MNTSEIERILQDSPAPAMRVDPDRVVDGGRRRVARSRLTYVGAGLAAALLVLVAGVAGWQSYDTRSLQPARHSPTARTTSPFFTHDPTVATNQFQSSVGSGTATYSIVERSGVLRIRRGDDRSYVDLPVVGTFRNQAGIGTSTNDHDRTVVVVPVPADTLEASLDISSGVDPGGMESGGVITRSGSTAAVFVTEHHIAPSAVKGWWWRTRSGEVVASTGEHAATVGIGGGVMYQFVGQGLYGMSLPGLSGSWHGAPGDGHLASATRNRVWTTAGILPPGSTILGPVVPPSRARAVTVDAVQHAPLGPDHTVAWFMRSRSTDGGSGSVSLRWRDAAGTVHLS
ncbi:hypothetical protein [Luteipulveratus flavus]|uniref:Uncharacterized protein n=1 Tax=Luteipulveratus flavus TaxID=3031728 RepID=A0ABT6C7H4_9MICO|nr:hypothetical protein [Luteipulveratus sp. YIM 133296]MDF8264830.1 hypothetical protein [Luteipulveratus sp. YIM 133296]